jgi:uncharacterized protein (DUF1330 family)
MSAYVIVQGTVKDAEKMQEYGAAAGPSIAPHGGELVCRGPAQVLAGATDYQMAVVISFPDAAAARAWYESPEYQAIIPTREAALDSVFVLVGE